MAVPFAQNGRLKISVRERLSEISLVLHPIELCRGDSSSAAHSHVRLQLCIGRGHI